LLLTAFLAAVPGYGTPAGIHEHLGRLRLAADGWYGKSLVFRPGQSGNGKVCETSDKESAAREIAGNPKATIIFVRGIEFSTWYQLRFADDTEGWALG